MRSPGWISLRLLAAFGTLAVSMSAVVTWLNLRGFRSVLGPDAAARMTDGALAVSVCAVMCIGAGAVADAPATRARIRRGDVCCRAGGFAGRAAAFSRDRRAHCLAPRGANTVVQIAPAHSSASVTMILLDGASLDFIAPNAAGGRFPNFGRLLESGAVMHLATLRPTQPAPVWTAVATGKLPYKTGVYSAARYVVPGTDQRLDLLAGFLLCAGAGAARSD